MASIKHLIEGCDAEVALWVKEFFGYETKDYTMAVWVANNHWPIGAAIFHCWNGPDVEVSYYGPGSMDLKVLRMLCRLAVDKLCVARVTARTARNNKQMTKGIKKLGFEYEGIRHNGYGEHDAVMYGLYGKKLARLAGKMVN